MRQEGKTEIWAYMCLASGLVHIGPVEATVWFADGYGDYTWHFVASVAAVPEWTPPGENHIASSSSIVQDISYAAARVAYRTFDRDSTEVLRVHHAASGEIQVFANDE